MQKQSFAKAIFYTIACVFLWALIPVVSKIGQTNLDNHQFLFYSSLVSFLLFALLSFFTKSYKTFKKLDIATWIKTVSLGFLGTYLYYILLYFGYKNAKGLEVLVLQYSWPIFIILLSTVLLREKFTKKKGVSLFLGFFGVIIILTKGDLSHIYLNNFKVDILVVIAAFSFALFSVLSKKVSLDGYTLNTIYFLTATICSFISMLTLSSFKLPDTYSLLPIIINGLFVNGISYLFWIKALRYAPASFVAPFIFLTPVISSLYLIFFFGETFLNVYFIGMVLVILSGIAGTV